MPSRKIRVEGFAVSEDAAGQGKRQAEREDREDAEECGVVIPTIILRQLTHNAEAWKSILFIERQEDAG
jgi:hypothetical protein